jgi:hypothetical protein
MVLPVVLRCANQRLIGQSLPDGVACNDAKAVAILDFPVIKSERFRVNVTEQMLRIDRNVRPFDATFKERPEIF